MATLEATSVSRPNSHAHSAGRRGLTIIELVIGVAIIAVLTAVAVPQYVGYVQRTELRQAVADIRMLETHIERFRTEMGTPPNDLGAVLDTLPKDPWGNSYEYIRIQGVDKPKSRKDKNLHPLNSDYDLYSKGADGDTDLPLTAAVSHDDVIRANDGAFVGLGEDY
jgi:general secretion pathway protein G